MIDGKEPGEAGFEGHAGNHQQIREWLLALGCEPSRVEGMRPTNLFKAYRYPEYLRYMMQRKEYFPNGRSCEAVAKQNEQELPQCSELPSPSQRIGPAPSSITITRGSLIAKPSDADASSPNTPMKDGPSSAMLKGQNASAGATNCSTPKPISKVETCATIPSSAIPDKVEALVSMLQEFAGAGISNGLTEARVIELIREHAPQIIKECLS